MIILRMTVASFNGNFDFASRWKLQLDKSVERVLEINARGTFKTCNGSNNGEIERLG
jgi:hypothetical protein